MLFLMVIDTLNNLICRAASEGVLQRLTARHMTSSVSIYADDVVVFCRPDGHDLTAVRELLRVFGAASGLHTNYAKCAVSPIQCTDADRAMITVTLACLLQDFPTTYLGLPLSIRKVSSTALQPIIDKLEHRLSPWWASLMSRGDRLALCRHVLSAMPTHIMIAMAINPPILKRINRLIRNFLWYDRKDASGGHCKVN
ncbi:uncharacterized protein [Aegilops tauschii subsp. strangulata]|uniref:uncharacterized protein n=1 Tax=Aegilops tauschii subsp. strangulata TaxID=200361 RepID=UPI003CC89B8B